MGHFTGALGLLFWFFLWVFVGVLARVVCVCRVLLGLGGVSCSGFCLFGVVAGQALPLHLAPGLWFLFSDLGV